MDKITKIIEDLEKLDKNSLQFIIFQLMIKDKINYLELSNLYTEYLRDENKRKLINISGLATVLSMFWSEEKLKEPHKSFTKRKSAYHMLKSKVFKTAGFEKTLNHYLMDNPYIEDENGIPETK